MHPVKNGRITNLTQYVFAFLREKTTLGRSYVNLEGNKMKILSLLLLLTTLGAGGAMAQTTILDTGGPVRIITTQDPNTGTTTTTSCTTVGPTTICN